MKSTKESKPLRLSGFTLIEIMVVVAIIGLLMSVATLGINQAVKRAKDQVCRMNMASIEHAKQLWMLDNRKGDNDVATEDDLKGLLKDKTFPACPGGGAYAINAVNSPASCSVHGVLTTTGSAPAGN